MLISASYKTDLPAWYGEWFMNRLRAGFCEMRNPYNNVVSTVPLTREAVEGFVFWTRRIGPFLRHLPEVRERGYPFIIHHGLMDYPRALERTQVEPEQVARDLHTVAREYHPRVVIWRYDPILCTSLTPLEWHVRNFARLAALLAGATDEVVVSFAQFYQKTERNLARAAAEHDFTWEDPTTEVKCELIAELAGIAQAQGIQLAVCAQSGYVVPGTVEARCVDPFRLSEVAGYAIHAPKQPHRPGCGCYQARDIGAYNTCPHGCAYGYTVASCDGARQRHQRHDPQAAGL
ncbi:MAG: DUF1848 domain-containing protein, partial [Armatimonadota bacterium]